jgi:hypothetical protein
MRDSKTIDRFLAYFVSARKLPDSRLFEFLKAEFTVVNEHFKNSK